MTINLNELIRDFLDILESQEVQLLTWGIVDGGFTEEEIQEYAEDFLDNRDSDLNIWDFIN